MTPTSLIGAPIPKPDAPDKVTGRARYLQDLVIPGMLHGKILRANRPHARIVRIDTSAARALPGVHAVITAADIDVVPFGHGQDNTALKGDHVTCWRDEVAAVAAETEAQAQEALELIDVEYEDLPTVFDAEQALQPGAPVIHESCPDNVRFRYKYDHGDLAAAEKQADVVVDDIFDLPYVTHCCMGVSGIVADFDYSGGLTLHSLTQVPFLYRRDLSRIINVPPDKIRVIQPTIGGGFGSKLDIYPYEPICVWLARHARRPVRILFSREEEFVASPTRQPAKIRLRTGATKEGTLVFRDVDILLDNGGRTSWGATTPFVMMQTFSSLYRVPHVRYRTTVAYTNNPYAGSFRGYGNPQATFAIEAQMDRLAELLDLNPVAFRLQNTQEPGETTGQGLHFVTCGLRECLDEATRGIEYTAKWQHNRQRQGDRGHLKRGVGLASMVHVGGGAKIYRSDGCGTILKLDDFLGVTVISGSTDIGQGADTVITQFVAQELGLPVDKIKVVNNDTDVTPWDVGVHASRTTFVAGNSALMAARQAKEKLLHEAEQELGREASSLDLARGQVVDAQTGEALMDLGKLVRNLHFSRKNEVVVTSAYFEPTSEAQDRGFKGNVSPTYAFGTHVAEIEVDTETGLIQVLRLVAAHDVGRVINPLGIRGQVAGGVSLGLGYALSEELQVRDGEILNPNFTNYKIMTAPEMPRLDMRFIETEDPFGPYGAKGIGEAPAICVAAAVANALYNATGVRLRELPLTPERVLQALRRHEEVSSS
jgi:xanthine dehydrogenase molybdenum-binding subunit